MVVVILVIVVVMLIMLKYKQFLVDWSWLIQRPELWNFVTDAEKLELKQLFRELWDL